MNTNLSLRRPTSDLDDLDVAPDERSLQRLATFSTDDYPAAPDGITAIVDVARELLGVSTVLVARQEGDAWYSSHVSGDRFGLPLGATLPLADTFCKVVLDTAAPLAIDDAPNDPLGQGVVAEQRMGVRTYIGVPLVGRDGMVLGTLCGLDRCPSSAGQGQLATLQVLGRLVANELERGEALAALERSERNLSDFFAQAVMPLHWVGADGTILRANQAELDLLGYDREDYVGHHIAEFHADGPVIEDILGRLGANEILRDYGARLRHKDGSIRDVLIDASVVWEDGKFIHTRCFTRDVTVRKAAEAQLAARARQQAAVAELGQRALTGADLSELFDEAVAAVSATLNVEYAKVLELLPDGQALLLRAGVGWRDGLVGQATVGAGTDSQAGYTLLADEPVIVADLRSETRFSVPPLLREHEVVSGLSAIIRGHERPYGVLGAHTTEHRVFTADDAQFLRSVANVLAAEIERRRAEEVLREARFRSLVENAHDLVSIVEADGTIRYVSPASEMIFGMAPAELIGTQRCDMVHPDDQERSGTCFAAVITRPGHHPPVELRYRHQDGSWRWLELRMTNRLDDPDIAGIVVNGLDVTEHKEAEERLRQSEANQAQAQRLAHLGSWELDATTGTFDWSAESYRIFGLDPDLGTMTLDRAIELVHPADRESLLDSARVALEHGEAYETEFRVLRPDGTERVVHGLGEAVRDASGEVVGLRGANHDVTEQRHAEEARRMALAAWSGSFDALPDHISILDRSGTIIQANKSMRDRFEPIHGHLIGLDYRMCYCDTATPDPQPPCAAVLMGGAAVSSEMRLPTMDGWYFVASYPIDIDGERQGAISVVRDITERKEAVEALAHQALHDPLTDLPNRRLFEERLREVLATVPDRETGVAVLLLDLDHFKVINDSLGHAVGDELLIAVGLR
ncbi:MAG: PAS domain S-box protein, partial [Chloroflexota bacterium]|nr:PAS domain S-box protein [Chloroflexota bacterium]